MSGQIASLCKAAKMLQVSGVLVLDLRLDKTVLA